MLLKMRETDMNSVSDMQPRLQHNQNNNDTKEKDIIIQKVEKPNIIYQNNYDDTKLKEMLNKTFIKLQT